MKLVQRVLNLSRFLVFYAKEVWIANLRIAQDVLSPGLKVKPGFFTLRLRTQTELELLAVANLVTMTPGTLSVDVSPDGRELLVHAMYAEDIDELKASIEEGLQTKVLEVFRW